MAATTILNFVTSSNSIKPACSASQDLFDISIGWKSIQLFNSYSFLYKFKMAAAAIWDFFTIFSRRVKRYNSYLAFKFGGNRSNSSKVTAHFTNSRWRPPPFWILVQVQIQSSRRVVRHRTHLVFWLGEYRSNGSKVTAFCLNSRCRPPPSWISLWSLRRYPRWFCSMKCTLISNLMKIGWLVQKLQLLFKILILARISAFRGVLG